MSEKQETCTVQILQQGKLPNTFTVIILKHGCFVRVTKQNT